MDSPLLSAKNAKIADSINYPLSNLITPMSTFTKKPLVENLPHNAPHYLCVGVGKIGQQVANTLAEQGLSVTAVSRSFKSDLALSITQIQADARVLTAEQLGDTCHTITHICIIVSPSEISEQGYRDSYFAICQNMLTLANHLPNLERVVYVSSTSVYGQNHGELIDSSTPIEPPTSKTAQVLLATEQLLQQHFGKKCTIIRASGIYGKQRLRLVKMTEQLANHEIELPQNSWTNRIFDTDLVKVIVHVLTQTSPLTVYLASDFEPVAMYEVLEFLAKAQGVTLTLPNQRATTGKRLISNLPENWLHYPHYQTGYQAILQP